MRNKKKIRMPLDLQDKLNLHFISGILIQKIIAIKINK